MNVCGVYSLCILYRKIIVLSPLNCYCITLAQIVRACHVNRACACFCVVFLHIVVNFWQYKHERGVLYVWRCSNFPSAHGFSTDILLFQRTLCSAHNMCAFMLFSAHTRVYMLCSACCRWFLALFA